MLRRLALGLSYGVNPLVLPPILFSVIAHRMGAPTPEVRQILLITAICFMVVPFAFLVYLVRTSRVESVEVRNRLDRTRPYLVGIGSYVAGLALLATLGTTAVALMVSLAVCMIVNTGLVLAINLRWKISAHASGLAGFISMLLFVEREIVPGHPLDPVLAWSAALLIPVMWSRVRLGAHTVGQVIAGALYGLALPYAELTALSYLRLY